MAGSGCLKDPSVLSWSCIYQSEKISPKDVKSSNQKISKTEIGQINVLKFKMSLILT